MKRNFYQDLISWKGSRRRKPLMVIGARQVGKTFTLEEFCTNEYASHTTVNLFERGDIVELYETVKTAEDRFEQLLLLLNIDPRTNDHILFVDEVQESETFISDLKFLNEKHPEFALVCAGSLLGVRLKRFHKAFPVGQVSFLRVYPMTFDEFLWARGLEHFIPEIQKCFKSDKPLATAIHERLLRCYREYLCVGGMPEFVLSYLENGCSLAGLSRTILDDIVLAYKNDMNKYVTSEAEALKIDATYDSLPAQLGNKANKFMYGKIERSARKRTYETSIDWLIASQMVAPCYQVSKPHSPLSSYRDVDSFKLYMSDTGILSNELHVPFARIMGDTLGEKKGLLAESYVAQELVSGGVPLYHWSSQSTAEVNFLLETEDDVIPIEVKSGDNVRSKSLKVYCEKYAPRMALRVSSRNFGFENNIKSLPLYAAFCLRACVETAREGRDIDGE
jgi:predicted AAA+ superfamily ATPase